MLVGTSEYLYITHGLLMTRHMQKNTLPCYVMDEQSGERSRTPDIRLLQAFASSFVGSTDIGGDWRGRDRGNLHLSSYHRLGREFVSRDDLAVASFECRTPRLNRLRPPELGVKYSKPLSAISRPGQALELPVI